MTDITDDTVAVIGRMIQKTDDIDKYDEFIKKITSNQFVILAENSSKVLDNMGKYVIGNNSIKPSLNFTDFDKIITLMAKNGMDTTDAMTKQKEGINLALKTEAVNANNIDGLLPIIKLAHKYGDESVDFDMDFITSVVKINASDPEEFIKVERYLLMIEPDMVPATRNAFFLQKFVSSSQTNLLETMSKLGYKYDDLVDMGIKDMASLQRQGLNPQNNLKYLVSIFEDTTEGLKNMKRFGVLDVIDRVAIGQGQVSLDFAQETFEALLQQGKKNTLAYMTKTAMLSSNYQPFIGVLKDVINTGRVTGVDSRFIDEILKPLVKENSEFFEALYKNMVPLDVSPSVFTTGLQYMTSRSRILGVQFIREYLHQFSDNFQNPKANFEITEMILDMNTTLADIFTLDEFIQIFDIQEQDLGRYLLAFKYVNEDDLRSLLPENMTIDLFVRKIFNLGMDDSIPLTETNKNNFLQLLSDIYPDSVVNGVPINGLNNVELSNLGVSPDFFIRYNLLTIFNDAGFNISDEFDLFVNKYNAENEDDILPEETNALDISPEGIGSNPAVDSFLRQTVAISDYKYNTKTIAVTYKGQVKSINVPQIKFINYIKLPQNVSSIRDFYEYLHETMYNIYLNPRYNNDIKNLLLGNILYMIENGENKIIDSKVQLAIYNQIKEDIIDNILFNMGKTRQRGDPSVTGEGDEGKKRLNELNYKMRQNDARLRQKLYQLELCWKKSRGQNLSGARLERYIKNGKKRIERVCRKRQDVFDNCNKRNTSCPTFNMCVTEERHNFFIEYYENIINNIDMTNDNYPQVLNQVKDMINENIIIFGYNRTEKKISELFNLITNKLYINSKNNNKV
jgi:hypothetical protein